MGSGNLLLIRERKASSKCEGKNLVTNKEVELEAKYKNSGWLYLGCCQGIDMKSISDGCVVPDRTKSFYSIYFNNN